MQGKKSGETVGKLQPQATFHQPQGATLETFFLRGAPDCCIVSRRGAWAGRPRMPGPPVAALAPPKAGLAGSDQKSTQPEVTQRNRRRLHASTQRPQLAPSCLRILDSTATHCCRRSERCTFDCPNLHSAACLPTKTRPQDCTPSSIHPALPTKPNPTQNSISREAAAKMSLTNCRFYGELETT